MSPTRPLPEPATPVVGVRRYVTVLFADVCGSSEHVESMDPEAYAAILRRFRDLARDIVATHGGIVARLQGDGLLALFGHLRTREDDGRRAIEAALALRTAAAGLTVRSGTEPAPMQLHSGVHAGLVLLIDGDIELGRYDVVGEAVNTTARLSSLAAPGEVLVSVECLGPQVSLFQTRALGHLPIRGRREMLEALSVQGRAAEAGRRIDAAAQRGVVAFAGRQAVVARLHQALADSSQRPVTVVLRGEPGIGKTRAADEFLQATAAQGTAVFKGFCEDGLGAEPLQPFVQVLRSVLGWRPGAAATFNEAAAQRALTGLGQATEGPLHRFAQLLLAPARPRDGGVSAVREALLHLLRSCAAQGPLALMLDDWQWADDASRQLLQALLEAGLPALVLLTSRPVAEDDPALAQAQVLDISPLTEADAAAAIRAWLPGVNTFVEQEIFRLSGGSPLFIEELCHAEAAGRGLRVAPRTPRLTWVNLLVASRVEGLSAAAGDVLRVASVLGMSFPSWMLDRLAGTETAALNCALLQGLDFLVPASAGHEWRFKHLITRDAVYATVPLEQRRALHGEVAQLLLRERPEAERHEHLESLAYHFNAAEQPEQATTWAEAAGDRAFVAMALDRARAQYLGALRALESFPALSTAHKQHWCSLAQKLGQTCVFDALDVTEALPYLERAATLAAELGQANAMARAHYWLGYVNYGRGQPRSSVAHCRQALEQALASDDERLATQVRATLGQALASAGRYDEALPAMARAVEEKRHSGRPGSGAAIGSAYTLARIAYTLGDLGRFDEAYAHFDESLVLLGEVQHAVRASVLELRCVVLTWQGRWAEARALGLQGAEVALRCRSRFNTEMGRALAACAGWAGSADPAELEVLRSATAWIEARGGAVSTSLNYGWLVHAAVDLGDEAEARRHAARLLRRARAQDRHGEAQGLRALARLAWQKRQWGRAEHWLQAAERSAAHRGSPREAAHNQLARAACAAAAGRTEESHRQARAAEQAFQAMQMPAFTTKAAALQAHPAQG